MSHPLWELVHHKNNYCHFESGRCTSQKKHITDFEVLQATEGMCVLWSHYVFSHACLFVCLLEANTLLNDKRFIRSSIPFSLSQLPYTEKVPCFYLCQISCISNDSPVLIYQKVLVRRIQEEKP